MRVLLLAHSTLWVEHGGTTVLVDPWLSGRAYDESWELLPAPAQGIESIARPDFVAYSHGHPDHCHAGTLEALGERFGRDLPILVPKQALPSLPDSLRGLGFSRVRELTLGGRADLGGGLGVTAWATRADDATLVFDGGGATVVDANDCILSARTLAALRRRHPHPDLCLGQFAAGDAYPFALDGIDEAELRIAAAAPTRRLAETAAALGARCAAPIGSFFRWSHEDNARLDRWRVSPDEAQAVAGGDVPFEVIHPGDGWSDGGGFERRAASRERYEAAAAASCRLAPRRSPPPPADVETVAALRFGDMLARIPAPFRRRLGRLGFHLDDLDRSVLVDWAAGTLTWGDGPPDAAHYAVGAEHFARACGEPAGWSDFHVAGRFRVRRWRESDAVAAFLPLSVLYALGYLGTGGRRFSGRAAATLWARRGEAVDILGRLLRGRLLGGGPLPRL